MTVRLTIPGGEDVELERLVLDVNGTLSDRGEPIVCAVSALEELRGHLELHVVSADTFGTARALAESIQAQYCHVATGQEKRDYLVSLGARKCVAVGNGRNDALMLGAAALGIAVIGPEGLHRDALAAADVIALSIDEALRLLAEPKTLVATLRP